MRVAILFTIGFIGGAAIGAAPLPFYVDWRLTALAVAIAGGVLFGITRFRREAIRRRMVREYQLEED